MARLFRQKYVCFYCGIRSAQNHPPKTRQWQCENCEAQNHLDEQGQITDPPPLDMIPDARFARPVPRPASPELASTDTNLFCSACLKNQMIVTEILASADSKHEEDSLEYRRELEVRYPQVCSQCEPRVRERIRASKYVAKTDNLRRMMERSRGGGRDGGFWNWKNPIISLGAIGWCTSLAGQLLWDIQGVLMANREEIVGEDDSSSISTCLQRGWTILHVTSNCSMKYDSAAGLTLGLGLLFIWWNPRLKEKSRKGGVRMVGKAEYYQLQLMLLFLRFASWSVLRSPTYHSDARIVKAVHSLMLAITLVLTVISLRSIRLDFTPRVLFQDGPEPLGTNAQGADAESHNMISNPPRQPDSYKTQSPAYQRPFSVNDLAPSQPYQPPYNPPTPPPEDDEAEAMDWTPSQQSLPPASIYRQPKPTRVEPSPFYGRLPQTPKSQAHKLRNPNQPTFQKASSAQKQNFFKRPHKSDQDEVSELGSDSESVSTRVSRSEVASPQFAPPRFFPGSDFLQDTGLESIFSQTFSIAEEPREPSMAREGRKQSDCFQRPDPIVQRLSVLSLLFSIMAWWHASRIPVLKIFLRFASLGVASLVAGRGLLQCIQRTEVHRSWIEILLYTSELCFATFLGGAVKVQSMDNGLRLLGLVLFGAMVLQESWIIILTISNAPRALSSPSSTPDDSQTPKARVTSPPSKSLAAADTRPSRRSTTTSSSALSTGQSNIPGSSSGRTTRSSRLRLANSPSSTGISGLSLG